jgi:hypothetical protein
MHWLFKPLLLLVALNRRRIDALGPDPALGQGQSQVRADQRPMRDRGHQRHVSPDAAVLRRMRNNRFMIAGLYRTSGSGRAWRGGRDHIECKPRAQGGLVAVIASASQSTQAFRRRRKVCTRRERTGSSTVTPGTRKLSSRGKPFAAQRAAVTAHTASASVAKTLKRIRSTRLTPPSHIPGTAPVSPADHTRTWRTSRPLPAGDDDATRGSVAAATRRTSRQIASAGLRRLPNGTVKCTAG